MPTLKQLNCSIELGSNNIRLPEYGTTIGDGHIETFVPVPDVNIPFTISLKVDGYIAPGLAAFVYMDGDYQCNRNRAGLQIPTSASDHDSGTEFRFRQKEEKKSDGTYVVRPWTFQKLNRGQ